MSFAQWGEMKASGAAPLGQLPFIETAAGAFAQSIPISKYACALAGLYPADALTALKADELVATIDEMWNKISATSKDKPETRVAYAEDVCPKYLALLAKRLGSDEFFGGASAPQFADLWFYAWYNIATSGFFDHVPTDFVARHAPTLDALAKRVKDSELYAKFGTPE